MSERPTIHEVDEEEMNLTPLLDVIFILLFFFLVVAGHLRLEIHDARAPR